VHNKILTDIQGDNPCGIDAKYEDSFSLIEQEIDKDSSVTSTTRTDWDKIIKSSEEFLFEVSKDLKIATWWFYGMWKVKSWDGLNTALNIYVQLLEKYQKNIFPTSVKIKTNVFIWLETKLSDEILSNKNNLKHETELFDNFNKLNIVIQNILDKEEKYFGKITRLLEPIVKDKLKKEEVKNTPEIKEEKQVSGTDNEISNNSDATKVLSDLRKTASSLAQYYRTTDFKDIKAIRISRFLSFLDVEGTPFNNNNISMINPPLITEIDEVIELINNAQHNEAFILIEEILEVCPFWFEGHLKAYEIMIKLNQDEIANEIKHTFLSFINTNKELLNISFKDNTPFATAKIKKWIEEESSVSTTLNKNNTTINVYESIMENINDLASNNKLLEAMQSLEEYYLKSSSIEEKFNWRLHHARLAIEFDKKDIALALLEELENMISLYSLDEWNPSLASQVYYLILDSFTNMDIETIKIESLYKKLCKIDVQQALKIKI